MSWTVRFTKAAKAAEEDLNEARRWYADQAEHLSSALRREVRRTVRRIGENPHQFPEIYRGVRRALVFRFPYTLFFRVRAQAIQVIAVTHQARDPETWKRRA